VPIKEATILAFLDHLCTSAFKATNEEARYNSPTYLKGSFILSIKVPLAALP